MIAHGLTARDLKKKWGFRCSRNENDKNINIYFQIPLTSEIFRLIIQRFDGEIGRRGAKALLILDNAGCHKINFDEFKNIKVEFLAPNMTGYMQPLDMGYFATLKKRIRSWRRTYLLRGKSTNLKETITKAANEMTSFNADLVRCFWKVGGLIDATESDTDRIGEIQDLQANEISVEDRLTENLDGNNESEESESDDVQEIEDDVQEIEDGVNELEITTAESRPSTLTQSQITAFFTKK